MSIPYNISVFTVHITCDTYGFSVTSHGLFRNDESFHHMVPTIMLQIGAAIIVNAILQKILTPLNQPRFVAEMMTGILLGPSILGGGELYQSLFKFKQEKLLDLLEFLWFAMYGYIVAVRTDVRVVKDSGKLVWFIGISSFVFPILLSHFLKYILPVKYIFDNNNNIGALATSTTFHVTFILLDDLKLINSEIGRLALSSSLITCLCSWIFTVFYNFYVFAALMSAVFKKRTSTIIMFMLTFRFILILVVLIALRPAMLRLIRKIPEGNKNIKETHFLFMVIMLFGVAFTSESLGYTASFGAMILGLAVPPGPPLGSGMVEKLSLVISKFFMPAYIINAGHSVNVFLIDTTKNEFTASVIVIIATYLGKLAAAIVPLRLCKMPSRDALVFGLIVSSQGIFDVSLFKLSIKFTQLNYVQYTILTIAAVLKAAIATPLIGYLYDPSKRYINYNRRTIQHSRHDREFQLTICIHEEDDVINILNILKASHPTAKSPLGVCVLDLIELAGQNHPLLINHQFHKDRSSSTLTRTDRIINAFHQFELQHEGIKHQHFTAISPYISMHNDICTLALEKSASLLIIPCHKSESTAIRGVKRNVLDMAPCSVGILVDKKIIPYWTNWHHSQDEVKLFNVCVIFLGGPDSREALALGTRMVENPAIRLTVIRLIAEEEFLSDMLDTNLDVRIVTELRSLYADNERIEYREVMVKDGANTMQVLQSIDDSVDLVLVGRRIDDDSSLVTGLADWSSIPELGIVGDILASSDIKSNASVLVLQQQSTVEDLLIKKS